MATCRVPRASSKVTPVTQSSPSMAIKRVPRQMGMRMRRGSQGAGQRAVTRAFSSTIASGRTPTWRRVRIAENETSSVPTMIGRSNGRRPFNVTRPCKVAVFITPPGLVPPMKRAARVALSHAGRDENAPGADRIDACLGGEDEAGPRLQRHHGHLGADLRAGGGHGGEEAARVGRAGHGPAELAQTEGRVAAVAWDAARLGLALKDENAEADPPRLKRCAEASRAAADDDEVVHRLTHRRRPRRPRCARQSWVRQDGRV